MAVRKLNYCPPLRHAAVSSAAEGPIYFCQSCGHGLAGLSAPAIARAHPALEGHLGSGTCGRLSSRRHLPTMLVSSAGCRRRTRPLPRRLAALVGLVDRGPGCHHRPGPPHARSRTVAWIAGLAVLAGYQPLFWSATGHAGNAALRIRLTTRWVGPRPARATRRELAMVASACRSALASPGGLGTPAARPGTTGSPEPWSSPPGRHRAAGVGPVLPTPYRKSRCCLTRRARSTADFIPALATCHVRPLRTRRSAHQQRHEGAAAPEAHGCQDPPRALSGNGDLRIRRGGQAQPPPVVGHISSRTVGVPGALRPTARRDVVAQRGDRPPLRPPRLAVRALETVEPHPERVHRLTGWCRSSRDHPPARGH